MFQPTARWMRLSVRCLSLAVLLALSIVIPALSPRCGFAGEKTTRDTVTPTETKDERPPFDLTYVPPDAMGVIAIRPSAIFSDPAMKPLAGMVSVNPMMTILLSPYMPTEWKLPIQEVEQIILYMMPVPDGKQSHSVMGMAMIRAAHDFDWLKLMRRFDPKTTEFHSKDGTYYRSNLTSAALKNVYKEFPGENIFNWYLLPDKRSLVIVPFDLRAAQTGKFKLKIGSPRPHFSWDKEWKHVEHDLIAYAQVNRQTHGASEKQSGEDPFPEWASLTQKVATMVASVDWKDGIALRVYLACKEPAAAERAMQDFKSFAEQSRRELVKGASDLPKDVPEPERRAMAFQVELWKSLYDGVRITRTESTVCIHSKAKMTVAELAKGLMYQFELSPTAIQTAPARK